MLTPSPEHPQAGPGAALTIAPFEGPGTVWDQFGRSQEGWTAFHRWGWRQVIEDTFGHQCIYLAASDPTGALCGLLPLVRVRSLLFGHYIVSMPFLNYGGPIGTSSAIPALAAAAAELAR